MSQTNETEDAFEKFLQKNILPLLESEDKYRQSFKNHFWLYAGVLLFFNCSNVLIVLFRHLIYNRPFSWEQLFLTAAISAFILFCYVKFAGRKVFPDVFAEFVKYYGNWSLRRSTDLKTNVHDIILPSSPLQIEKINISGDSNCPLKLKKLAFVKKLLNNKLKITVGEGIFLTYNLPQSLGGTLLLLEKGGFAKIKQISGLDKVSSAIPASNYFQTFADSEVIKNYLVISALYENLLDLKEVFKASKIYLRLENDKLDVFLQSGHFLYHNGGLWTSSTGEDGLKKQNQQIEKVFLFISVMEDLIEVAKEHV